MTESNYDEAVITTDPKRRSAAIFAEMAATLNANVSDKIVVTRTPYGCRVEVNGIDITYWMASGSAPAVSFPEGKPPVVTVHLTAEDFQIREEQA